MFLTSVVIVLREVLEAVLLLSIFFALSQTLHLNKRWLYSAIIAGALSSVVYGMNIGTVSNALDGAGQEIFNACLQFTVTLLIVVVIVFQYRAESYEHLMCACLTSTTLLAITRESSEIYLYLSAFVHNPEYMQVVMAGTLTGAGIGFSIGALFYYLIVAINRRHMMLGVSILLSLVGAGMVSKATNLLTQIDWLPAQAPLINTEGLIPEASVTGQLLYALVGYESTPSALQLIVHIGSLCIMLTLSIVLSRLNKGSL